MDQNRHSKITHKSREYLRTLEANVLRKSFYNKKKIEKRLYPEKRGKMKRVQDMKTVGSNEIMHDIQTGSHEKYRGRIKPASTVFFKISVTFIPLEG